MKITNLRLTVLCISILCLFFPLSLVHVEAKQRLDDKTSSAPDQVIQLAEHTVKELSQNSEFVQFTHANLNIMPLGPGTHSYLVHVLNGNEVVGYLIITAEQLQEENFPEQETRYLVTEYGVGSSTVFDPELLPFHDQDVRMNYNGILSYWVLKEAGKSIYIDAATGDKLPDNLNDLSPPQSSETAAAWIDSHDKFTKMHKSSVPFDPYENLQWIVTTPVPLTSESMLLTKLDASEQLIFSSPGNNMWYSGPLAISGYNIWTSPELKKITFLRINSHHTQIRYIPAARLLGKGNFHEHSN